MNKIAVRECWSDGDIGYIPLTRGQVAKVDISSFDEVSKWNWYAYFDPSISGFYAVRNVQIGSKRTILKLHRFLMGIDDPKVFVDHVNRNTLDNRLSNLRLCSPSESCRNQGKRKDNSTGVKGVSFFKKMGKYMAYVNRDKKRLYLGLYDTLESARDARYAAALAVHEEFACLG